MVDQRRYLISQAGRLVAIVEAADEASALNRAKGLSHIVTLMPSLPITASPANNVQNNVPSFSADYFEMLGYKK
jgi:hypothetical protein